MRHTTESPATRPNNSKTVSAPASDKARTYRPEHSDDLRRDLDGLRTMYAVYRRHTTPTDEAVAAFICIQAGILARIGSAEEPQMFAEDFPDGNDPVKMAAEYPAPVHPVPTEIEQRYTVSEWARLIGLRGFNFHFSTRLSRRASHILKDRRLATTYNDKLTKTFPADILQSVFSSIV